jgi:hypothetical protein
LIWFDAQDLSNITNVPTTPLLRLENKAGPGYAQGSIGAGSVYPTLVGVTNINNKRAVYFNNSGGEEAHLQFFDTRALRPGGGNFTVFYVGQTKASAEVGLIGFKGQNDLGTIEEANWLIRRESADIATKPALRGYSKTAAVAEASSRAPDNASTLSDPFYVTAIFKNGANTEFYYNGTSIGGSATIATRYLDGDGFIGAGLASNCVTPDDFGTAYFGEVLVYDGVIVASDIELVNAWLANKWGF